MIVSAVLFVRFCSVDVCGCCVMALVEVSACDRYVMSVGCES